MEGVARVIDQLCRRNLFLDIDLSASRPGGEGRLVRGKVLVDTCKTFGRQGEGAPDSVERRLFLSYGLKITGIFLGGSILSLTTIRKANSTSLQGMAVISSQSFSPHYAMVIRQSRCDGCRKCIGACGGVNNVPAYGYRAAVLQRSVSPGAGGGPLEFLPVLCNQCNKPPCAKVCPTKATYKNKKNGIVMNDSSLCIGCKTCMASCPYNAIYFNNESKSADKCDFCFRARLERGVAIPACVEVCPAGVFIFGDLGDEKGELYKFIHGAETEMMVLRPELGTLPNVFYIKE